MCRTIHWDPDSYEGKLVGYRVRILDIQGDDVQFKEGRIMAYDAYTNMHKIFYKESYDDNCVSDWLWLEEETVQLYGDVVWAKVKGFSWWPAQVLVRDDADETLADVMEKKHDMNWARVSFFDHPDVTNIRDSPATLKRFTLQDIDNVPKKKNIQKVCGINFILKHTGELMHMKIISGLSRRY